MRLSSQREKFTPQIQIKMANSSHSSEEVKTLKKHLSKKSKQIPHSPKKNLKGVEEKPKLLSQIAPEYPYLSRVYKEEGKVSIKVTVTEAGEVLKTQVIQSSSYPRLDQAAIEAINRAPFEYKGESEGSIELSFTFKLE